MIRIRKSKLRKILLLIIFISGFLAGAYIIAPAISTSDWITRTFFGTITGVIPCYLFLLNQRSRTLETPNSLDNKNDQSWLTNSIQDSPHLNVSSVLRKRPTLIIAAFLIAGAGIGIFVVAPAFNINKDAGEIIGLLFGLIASSSLPNLWKSLSQKINDEKNIAIDEDRYLNFWEYLFHPTQLPFTLAIILFTGFFAFVILFHLTLTTNQTGMFLFPLMVLIGLSGLIMVMRREYIKRSFAGYIIIRNGWAIFWGIMVMAFGWGTGIVMILSILFHW